MQTFQVTLGSRVCTDRDACVMNRVALKILNTILLKTSTATLRALIWHNHMKRQTQMCPQPVFEKPKPAKVVPLHQGWGIMDTASGDCATIEGKGKAARWLMPTWYREWCAGYWSLVFQW